MCTSSRIIMTTHQEPQQETTLKQEQQQHHIMHYDAAAPTKNTINNQTNSINKLGCLRSIIGIYIDQSGSLLNLTKGMSIMALFGSLFGVLMPKNPDLTGPYQTISSMIGYTYFIAWTVCFYPQIVTNYQLKSIDGLSTDSIVCGVLKNLFYTIYTASFFSNNVIRNEYKVRNGPDADITVMSNDVAYGVHALFLTLVLLGQILYYKGFAMSNFCKFIVVGMTVSALVYILCIMLDVSGTSWIDLLYLLATFNLLLTTMQYMPQIWLNYKRKSTQGKFYYCET